MVPRLTDDSEQGRWLKAAPQWRSLHGTFEDLQNHADGWPISRATPQEVATMLATTRKLFAHTWFVYEFGVAAVAWSLVTVEAALRHRLERTDPHDRGGLGDLLEKAAEEGMIDSEWATRLDAARRLRNHVSHGHMHGVWSPGLLSEVLSATHEFVAHLFPDTNN